MDAMQVGWDELMDMGWGWTNTFSQASLLSSQETEKNDTD